MKHTLTILLLIASASCFGQIFNDSITDASSGKITSVSSNMLRWGDVKIDSSSFFKWILDGNSSDYQGVIIGVLISIDNPKLDITCNGCNGFVKVEIHGPNGECYAWLDKDDNWFIIDAEKAIEAVLAAFVKPVTLNK